MRISIVGPNSQIPPTGWGAIESLIWDMRNTLTEMGHEVQIVNVGDPFQIVSLINSFSPDFVLFKILILYFMLEILQTIDLTKIKIIWGSGINNIFMKI
jgi:hypothetical protein